MMMKPFNRKHIPWLFFLITLIVTTPFFQSCEKSKDLQSMQTGRTLPNGNNKDDEPLLSMETKEVKNTTTSTASISTTISTSSISTTTTQILNSADSIVPNCQEELPMNPNINACIYEKNPVAQKGAPLNLNTDRNSILEELYSLQNYAIYIAETTDGLLKNEHFDVQIESDDEERKRVQLSDPKGQWTTPYTESDTSVDQVMIYHWVMYQKNWMQLNTGKWYATNKNIVILNERLNDSTSCAYWSVAENKIKLCTARMALSADVLAHEAGHANFSYSAVERSTNGICEKHVRCSDRKSLCELSGKEQDDAIRCCLDKKGCTFAINEGQADFHVAVLFPDKPQIGELISNHPKGITSCPSDDERFSRNPKKNTTLTADMVYDNCQDRFGGNGEIHLMGVLYNSIWWEIYHHTDTLKEDIVKLFTEHLPLINYSDDFETIGTKLIHLNQQMFPSEKSSKYSDIIQQEFERRGLQLSDSE